MGPLLNLWRLTRPLNGLITILTIVIAAAITGPIEEWTAVLLAAASAFLIAGAANTLNDVYDVEIDRINRPDRILASRKLALPIARQAAYAEYLLGIILGFAISWQMGFMATFFAALTAVYSARLKGTPGWGNLVVSLSTGAAFIYGGLAVQRAEEAFIPALFAFSMHLGREIVKDMEDLKGDIASGAETLPILMGLKGASRLVILNFIFLIILTAWPYFSGLYSQIYFIIVLLGVYPVLLFVMGSLIHNPGARLAFLSKLLKIDMLAGLLAIYLH